MVQKLDFVDKSLKINIIINFQEKLHYNSYFYTNLDPELFGWLDLNTKLSPWKRED